MAPLTRYKLTVASSADDLARQAAERMASAIDLALAQRDRAQIALAGGTTPAAAYRHLGSEHLPWERVDVVLGDERWVEPTDPASNARLLAETLLAQEPASRARFHPAPTDRADPVAGAAAYGELIASLCPGNPPRFDLMVLGLGDDGHTASLFPGTHAPSVRDRWVTVGEGKGLPRLTLTAPVLSAARTVIFLVSGAGKATALQRLLDPQESSERTPARLVRPEVEVQILADAAAAGALSVA